MHLKLVLACSVMNCRSVIACIPLLSHTNISVHCTLNCQRTALSELGFVPPVLYMVLLTNPNCVSEDSPTYYHGSQIKVLQSSSTTKMFVSKL